MVPDPPVDPLQVAAAGVGLERACVVADGAEDGVRADGQEDGDRGREQQREPARQEQEGGRRSRSAGPEQDLRRVRAAVEQLGGPPDGDQRECVGEDLLAEQVLQVHVEQEDDGDDRRDGRDDTRPGQTARDPGGERDEEEWREREQVALLDAKREARREGGDLHDNEDDGSRRDGDERALGGGRRPSEQRQPEQDEERRRRDDADRERKLRGV